MLHACVQKFDVTRNLEKFCKILGTKQALSQAATEDAKTHQISILVFVLNIGIKSKSSSWAEPEAFKLFTSRTNDETTAPAKYSFSLFLQKSLMHNSLAISHAISK